MSEEEKEKEKEYIEDPETGEPVEITKKVKGGKRTKRTIKKLPESVTEMILKLKECIENNKAKNNRKKFKNCLLKSDNVTKEGVNNRIYRKILLCKQYIETMELISKASAEGQLEGYTLLLGMLSNDDGIGEFLDMFNKCDLKQE